MHKEQGSSSYVFRIDHKGGYSFILKVAKEGSEKLSPLIPNPLERFNKTAFLCSHIDAGVRTPAIYDIGHLSIAGSSYVYLLQEYLPFPSALCIEIFSEDLLAFARELGKISAHIHSNVLSGYGIAFSASNCSFRSVTWSEFILSLKRSLAVDKLIRNNVLPQSLIESLDSQIQSLQSLECEPRLFHGDILYNWSNILIDPESAKIAGIIDWDYSGSGNPLVFELGSSLLSLKINLGSNQASMFMQAFLSGYGVTDNNYSYHLSFKVESIAAIFGCQFLISRLNRRDHLFWTTRALLIEILGKVQSTGVF